MNLTISEVIQILSTLLVVLTVVYKAGAIEQKLVDVVGKVNKHEMDITDIHRTQGEHNANLAALNQATGVYR